MRNQRSRPTALSFLVLSWMAAWGLVLAVPASIQGQLPDGLRITVRATGGPMEIHDRDPGGARHTMRGWIGGGEGQISYGRLRGGVAYGEGRLDAGAAGGGTLDVVTGEAMLGFQVLPWLTVGGGPRGVTVVGPDGDQHVRAWSVGASVSVDLVPGLAEGFGTFSGAVAGSGLGRGPLERGGGGEVGLEVTPPFIPVSVGMGYRLHRDLLPLSASQSVERIVLTVGMTFE